MDKLAVSRERIREFVSRQDDSLYILRSTRYTVTVVVAESVRT